MKKYERILVGIDASEQSYRALDKAIQFAKNNDAELFLAHVIDSRPLQTYLTINMDIAQQARILAQAEMDKAVSYVKSQGHNNMETKIEYGSPRNKIASRIPEEENIDLIVVGATGAQAIERLVMGSISSHIVRHAPCDVLIVR